MVCLIVFASSSGTDSFSRLDLLRGISGAEKLFFSQSMREQVVKKSDSTLERVIGCPREVFLILSNIIDQGKKYLAGSLTLEAFEDGLADAEGSLRAWNADNAPHPTPDEHWKTLGDAFRYASILRVLRFWDSWQTAHQPRVQQLVRKTLDAIATVPSSSSVAKRLLLPLFLAGSDALSPHQQDYVRLRIRMIEEHTKFQNRAATDLLERVWTERANKLQDDQVNVPWMEFVSNTLL